MIKCLVITKCPWGSKALLTEHCWPRRTRLKEIGRLPIQPPTYPSHSLIGAESWQPHLSMYWGVQHIFGLDIDLDSKRRVCLICLGGICSRYVSSRKSHLSLFLLCANIDSTPWPSQRIWELHWLVNFWKGGFAFPSLLPFFIPLPFCLFFLIWSLIGRPYDARDRTQVSCMLQPFELSPQSWSLFSNSMQSW